MHATRVPRLLGEGSSKIVVEAKSRRRGVGLVALMRSVDGGHDDEFELLREACVIRRIGAHASILPLLDFGIDLKMRSWIETPLAPHGSIRDFADTLEFEGRLDDFGDAHVEQILTQVRSALQHVHAAGLRHCDLASRNVLVFDFQPQPARVTIQLADFGSTRAVRAGEVVEETTGLEAELRELLA
jgi:serine/threonine protein kinase